MVSPFLLEYECQETRKIKLFCGKCAYINITKILIFIPRPSWWRVKVCLIHTYRLEQPHVFYCIISPKENVMSGPNRRDFMKSGAAIGAGIAAGGVTAREAFPAGNDPGKVQYRELGKTGFKASIVGFGAMNTRDAELIDAAIDAGVNYIDTAHGYMRGVNEEVIGKVMAAKRDKVFLTTKVSRRDPDHIPEMIETSLKRLRTDHVDLLLLHGPSQREQILNEDFMRMFEDARKRGQTRFIGFSTHRNHAESLDLAVESKFWEAVTVGYNHLSPPEVTDSLIKARKAGIGIIAMKTQVKGKGYSGTDIDTDTITSQQAALKWVLNNQYVDTTIPGMTSFEQLQEDLAVMDMKFTRDDNSLLRKSGEVLKGIYCRGVAGCTGCRGECPKGVDICEINRCLGYVYGYGDRALAYENYADLPTRDHIETCDGCEACAVKCVNGINLTENIRAARRLFA